MARLIPAYSREQVAEVRGKSNAEADVYEALRACSSPITVLHSVSWIQKDLSGGARDGETDFLLWDGQGGVITLEVKGGGVAFQGETRTWTSTDRSGSRHTIKNPFSQAKDAKYALKRKLAEVCPSRETLESISFGHAVILPSLSEVSGFVGPDSPREIIAGKKELDQIGPWLEGVFNYWRKAGKASPAQAMSTERLILSAFARSHEAKPLVATRLAADESTHIKLTENQARVLWALGGRRKAAIAGGAGTGKTLLAVEKAKKFAAEGFQTLLTCYNQQLSGYLAASCAGTKGLEVMSFHKTCSDWVKQADAQGGRNLKAEAAKSFFGANDFDVIQPFALMTAAEILPKRYDAIVVDEGQDFRENYWPAIEMLLRDSDASPLYIFYDLNQNLYKNASTFPIKDDPFVLSINCRNTKPIHMAAYKFYGGQPTDPPDLAGHPLERLEAASPRAQAERIGSLVGKLVAQEKVLAGDIVVLLADARHDAKRLAYDSLSRQPLPRGSRWGVEEGASTGCVRIDTINRFKGLEASIVILWANVNAPAGLTPELLYVGITRAKSILYLCGTSAVCDSVLAAA